MTEPTDAEIRELWESYNPLHGIESFARAVLAKWGTPPVVAGRLEVTEAECEAAVLELETEDLRTTPQPTQPQADAVPLTDGQIVAAANEAFDTTEDLDDETLVNKYGHGVYISRFIDFARAIERAHGITGDDK